ncbi:MAG: InlB B-repeat-containing protein [Clostridia bacterium]|nr:InlB B-repeat-containing protein [Clostridia bacterium]
MAYTNNWTPFGVRLHVVAIADTVTRTSATTFTVKFTASWAAYYQGAQTNYGMEASSGGASIVLNTFGKYSSGSGEKAFTGTYSISGTGAAAKKVAVNFRNYNTDNGDSAAVMVELTVNVPAWPTYTVTYNANGGTAAPSGQTKVKDQTLTLSSSKPTRTGYTFKGWATSASGSVAYAAGASYTANAAVTLYAVWEANKYTVTYNANGGTGAPAAQPKTHGVTLTLSSTKPTRTNYNFKGWGTSASTTVVSFAAGGKYTTNANIVLYAIWELAYVKPRLSNFTVRRCDASGTAQDDGTYALVSFTWACDKTVSQILIKWKPATSAEYASSYQVTATGTSGTVSQVVGGGAFVSTSSYTIQATVADSDGSAVNERTLNSLSFTMHGKPGGDGIAFGKTAELGKAESLSGSGVAEFAFEGKFNQPVYGKALGMDKVPEIPADSDLNDLKYLEPGCYAIYSDAAAASLANCPVDIAGRFEVWSATGEGVRGEQWSYLRQRIIPRKRSYPVWEREISRGESNAWTYSEWWQSSLTPVAAKKVYDRAAATAMIAVAGGHKTNWPVQTYTQIPFGFFKQAHGGRLSLSGGDILIGANVEYVMASGQALVKCGTVAGDRHVRIQKVSGSTTTHLSWNCSTCTPSQNAVLTLTPAVISVKEGDILRMVFYTPDATDSVRNGAETSSVPQTYLTVIEI